MITGILLHCFLSVASLECNVDTSTGFFPSHEECMEQTGDAARKATRIAKEGFVKGFCLTTTPVGELA